MQIISASVAQTEAAGRELAAGLCAGDIIAFYGDLGAGKTAFIRGLAQGLGINASVTSPTYTIVNEYPGRLPLFHFDLYRLTCADDLFDIGWEDYIARGGVCAVEWAERAQGELCPSLSVTITRLDDVRRQIQIEKGDGAYAVPRP